MAETTNRLNQEEECKIESNANLLNSFLNLTPVNVIYCDKNFVIRYMNERSTKTLREVQHLIPVSVDNIIGTSIDSFHKKPEMQRELLYQLGDGCHEAVISLGDEKLELRSQGIVNQEGYFDGAVVTWSIATEKLKIEAENKDHKSQMEALGRSLAVIEFDLKGTILTANDNFLSTVGYTLDEIKGKHHRIFCDETYVKGAEYVEFWEKLGRGEFDSGEYKRFGKGGEEIWIQASYNPILDENGNVYKVVKFATDITQAKLKNAEFEGKLSAISKAQAVIEFDLKGNILTANDNFLSTVEYTLDEIKGNHHSMFCDPGYASSAAYKQFWEKLGRGEFDAGEYKRFGKGGKEIWINASYNPIFDADGRPYKVVKFATDITQEKIRNADFEGKLAAINKVQAVIEFDLKGIIKTANENFLNALGYELREIEGKHHSMFCEQEFVKTSEYKEFWRELGAGEFQAGRYKRVTKAGEEIWIQASYNPILNADGEPYKVVKFATDITEQVRMEERVKEKAREDQERVDTLLGLVEMGAKGDLTVEFHDERDDPLGQLTEGIGSMVKSLREVLSQVAESVEFVDGQIVKINNDSDTVAKGAQSLGSTVEEMNATVEEMSSGIEMIAESAGSANRLIKNTETEANKGAEEVKKSIEAMEEISKSSEDISEIIDVIRGIADQTNLLAFNAAIEAARAGEHGLGFSVVAEEVRKLAERSSGAAKEISKLIKDSIKKVGAGYEVSKNTSEAFTKIVEGVNQSSDALDQISHSTSEQASATKEVAVGIEQVASKTEASALSSSNIATQATDLSEAAKSLAGKVQKFKLN